MITVGVMSAPRRKPTIYKTIKSLRRANFPGRIIVYSEPQELKPIEGAEIKYNKERLGCFKNYHNALTDLIEVTETDFICVIGDDFDFSSILMSKLRYTWDGYHALYTPTGVGDKYPFIKKDGWHNIDEGWEGTWGGNYMMHKDLAKMIIEHPFYQNHLHNYKKNKQIDHCIPEVCYQLRINQYFHSPSLSTHKGKESTLGHKHTYREEGLRFVI